MNRPRHFSRGGRLALALAVGGGTFAFASAVHADIPDAGVIHSSYSKTTLALHVIDTSMGQKCNPVTELPLFWNQVGPTGVTGATGATGATGTIGATGATGPAGTLTSAYLDAYSSASQFVFSGDSVIFETNSVAPVGISVDAGHTLFTVASAGTYLVTVALENPALSVQLQVNGVGVGPTLAEFCSNSSCGFSRLLTLSAGDAISLVGGLGATSTGSGITIARIA
jgi:hypothetical protein